MSITAYWKATTGFNVNAYPVTLGKSLKLCTAEELAAHPMCGSNSPISNISYTAKYSELSSSILGRSAMNLTGGAQFKEPIPNNMANTWACEPAPTGDNAKVYRRVIFVACPTNVTLPNYCISDDCNENILIVENITSPNKLVASYGNPTYPDDMQVYFNFSIQLRHVCENPHSVWSSAPNQVQYTDVSDPDNPVTKSYYIYPVFIYVFGEHVFLIRDDYIGTFGGFYQNATTSFNTLGGGSSYYNFDTDDDYCLFLGQNVNGTGSETDLAGIFGDVFADPVPNPPVFIGSPISYQPTTLLNLNLKFKYSLSHSTSTGRHTRLNIASDGNTSRELRRQQMARAGVYFVENNKIFKPIISGGIVTTYGTAEVPSEIDTYTDLNHPVPSTPGGGGGGGGTPGEWDDMPGLGSSIGALAGARCYICSKTDITNLKNWMSKTEAQGGPPDGYDVLSSLISVMAFPINMTPASSGPATAITFTGLKTSTDNQLANIAAALLSIANSVGATPKTEVKTFTSTATALPSAGNPFTIDLGTCTCPTFYSADFPFVDYDASVELYLPFIGCMSLDTQTVMGNSLHAYMTIDPITGAIYSWCECTKNGSRVVVASGSGAIGVNTPITANQVGMAMAQIKNNAAQSRQTAIQSALTIGMGAITGVDKNISSVLMKHLSSGNKNIAIAGVRDYADALSVGAQQASMMALPNAIGANLNTGRANRQIAQANHNSVSGSAGGSTADWSCSYTPYLKIITPDVHDAGKQYEHTYGVPTILSGKLSTFKGLTFCANPDVSSISTATDQEKQQIFGLLSGGVYV